MGDIIKKLSFTMGACLAFGLSLSCAQASGSSAHWTYDGVEGPAHWGDLKAEYAACSAGRMQSPIDLGTTSAAGRIDFTFTYAPVALAIFNNGHTVQFNTANAGSLTANGKKFALLQVHFHAPSEHVVNTKHAPLEAHFVHKAEDGSLAVLGVFIEEGAENPALAMVVKHLPKDVGEPLTHAGTMIDPNGLLPAGHDVYRYMGSLTTPPCSEGVNWHVLTQRISASKAQIDALSAVLHHNNRPVQPLNQRLLVAPAK